MQLNICKHCRKIFQSKFKAYTCSDCKSIDDELFERIENYLLQYPNSNAIQIAEGLGVQAYEVLGFIEEGRLTIVKGIWDQNQ